MKPPAHTGPYGSCTDRSGSWLVIRDVDDAARLLRWLSHYAPTLRTELEERPDLCPRHDAAWAWCGCSPPAFPLVRLGCDQTAADALADIYEHFGRAGQEERDAAAGAGGWE